MLLTKELDIVVANSERKYYKEKGYSVPIYRNPIIHINIDDLLKRSNKKIECKCDICGKINTISYDKYNLNVERYNYYSCHGKCSRIKFKKKNLELFNCENPFQNEEIKLKCKKTLIKKIGEDNISKLQLTKELNIARNFKLHGVKTYFESAEFKLKSKTMIIQKYQVENVMHCPKIFIRSQERRKKSLVKNKFRDTNLYYQGTYEFDFLEKYYSDTLKNGSTIKYLFENKPKVYYPDFFDIKLNLIVEIKSSYFYDLELEKNLAKKKACVEQGYNFIFIIDKNYTELNKILNK